MFTAKDGKNFGNSEMGRHYDATRPAMKAADGEKDGKEKDMDDVVSEHGPAEHVEIHSHHEDGHVHKATHHTAPEAKEHIDKAFDEEGDEEESMPGKHGDPDGDEGGGMGIPGM
jgi:hypothetical protein